MSDNTKKIDKQEIYKQLDGFNNTPSNPNDKGSKSISESYLYMSNEIAQDRANYFDKVVKNKKFDNVIDLTFGSGTLTTHIVLDNDLKYKKLTFNDIEKNKERVNKNLKLEHSTITYNDILDKTSFEKKFDLIIFNPQIGGNYESGKIEFESIEPIIDDENIEEYMSLDNSKVTITKNEDSREIFIQSNDYSKTQMTEVLKDIKIYNYYDVFYKSKESKKEGQKTNIVKFRNTLKKISKDDTLILFYGEKKHYDILFKDYNFKRYLADDGSDLFIISKTFKESICYEKQANDFVVNEECKKQSLQDEKKDYDLKALTSNLQKSMSFLEGLGAVWGSEDEKDGEIKQEVKEQPQQHQESKIQKRKPFKNFLYKGKN